MGISGWQLLILLLIVVLVFGTKRLRNIGGDLGGAVKSFRKGLDDGEAEAEAESAQEDEEVTTAQLGAEATPSPTVDADPSKDRPSDI